MARMPVSLKLMGRPPGPEVIPPPLSGISASPSVNREPPPSKRKRLPRCVAQHEDDEDEGEAAHSCPADPDYEDDSANRDKASTAKSTKAPKRARKSPPAKNGGSSIKDLQAKIKTLESDKKKLEASLRDVTRESVLNARKGAMGVWDNAKVEAEVKSLRKDIRGWVKTYGTNKKISTFWEAEKKDILSACKHEAYQGVFLEANFAVIQELPKGAMLLLEAFLYAQSVHYLIARPFIFVDAVLEDHSRPNRGILSYGNYESTFREFAEALEQCEAFPDQSQRWTASMLQALKRMIIFDPEDVTESTLRREKSAFKSYRISELGISQLATDFIVHDKVTKHLLNNHLTKQQHDSRRDNLIKIYRKFREFAYHMWCRPSKVLSKYQIGLFDLEHIELDPSAVQSRHSMDLKMMKDSEVLIHVSPMISGEIIDPVTRGQSTEVVFLRHKIWTVDCQTHAQWVASQRESSGRNRRLADMNHPAENAAHNDGEKSMPEKPSVEDQTLDTAGARVSKDTNETQSSDSDATLDADPELGSVETVIQPSNPNTDRTHDNESSEACDAEESGH